MKRARHQQGSVVFNKRSRTWHFLWRENGKRRSKLIGPESEYPSKSAAWRAADQLKRTVTETPATRTEPTIQTVAARYEAERMPERFATARMYRSWLRNHIIPEWGEKLITELQPRPVELWLRGLSLGGKSKAHIRAMLRTLIDFAMWSGMLEISRNPIELVVVRGATIRVRQPRSLTVKEFQSVIAHLSEPYRTMALVAVCFGLRSSELLALKWGDIDWPNAKLTLKRAIVMQKIGDVKTVASRKPLNIDAAVLQLLKTWKGQTQFSCDEDWLFASPVQLGRLPYSYPGFWREIQNAALKAGLKPFGTHSFRHTYRSWLDAVGTPIAVQQRMMRHTDIRTTLNIYGDVVTDEMAAAGSRVAGLAFNGLHADCRAT